MTKILMQKYYKIINKETKETIAANKVVIMKDIPKVLISFDFEYFFTIEENSLFEVVENPEQEIVNFDVEKYKDYIALYRYIFENPKELIYKEFTLKELDPEIKDLVYTLNDLGFFTTGSCCGHGHSQAWVDILFYDFETLKKLYNIIDHKFKEKFFLTTSKRLNNQDSKGIYFELRSYNIGKEAFNDINELVSYLKIVLETKNDK